jgi:hypothetical protein
VSWVSELYDNVHRYLCCSVHERAERGELRLLD